MNTHKKRQISHLVATLVAGLACSANAHAVSTFYWYGGSGVDDLLSTSGNWSGFNVPTTGTDATLNFNMTSAFGGALSVENDLAQTPVYAALQFSNNTTYYQSFYFTIYGNQAIALRPTSSNFTVITNTSGNNRIFTPLRFDTNTVNGVVLDNARISVLNDSLTMGGSMSASQVNLSTSLGAAASLSMNNVSAKSFEANGGTHNLTGVLTANSVNLMDTNFTVSGGAGSINMSSGPVTVGPGSQFTLDNTATAVSNRLSGNVYQLAMDTGSALVLKGNATTDVTESIRLATYGQSSYNDIKTIKVAGAGANVLITLDVAFSAPSYVNYASNGVLGDKERIKLHSSSGYISPLLQDGLLRRGIVNGREFATYDDTKGVVSATTATALTGATSTDNVYISAGANLTGNTGINSLAVNNAVITGSPANNISLASGKLLTSGNVSIAPAINFGAKAGEIINLGNTVLVGGVNGSNGLRVSGGGQLELSHAGVLGGQFNNQGTLVLSANNALQGADVYNSGSLSIGSTTQNINSFIGGNVTGTGRIVAVGDIALNQNLVNVSLEGQNVSVFQGATPGNLTVNGNIHASGGITLGGDYDSNGSLVISSNLMNGVISGTASVGLPGYFGGQSTTTFTNQNTYTGSTVGNLILSGNGAIAASSGFSDGSLTMRAGSGDNGSLDRIGNAATVTLGDYWSGAKVLSLQGSGSVVMHEDIGALNVANRSRLEMVNGTGATSLRADALNLSWGGSLTLSLGDASSFYVDVAPGTYTNTNVVKDVYVEKLIGGELQNTWAAYDAGNGRIYEALVVEKTLNSAGSNEFVRVTDLTNQTLTGDRTVGAVNIDTNQEINGTGTLTVSSGQLLFWKDNTISIDNLVIGDPSLYDTPAVVRNEGTNTITSVISSNAGLFKIGAGNLVLTANNYRISGFGTEVREGAVTVASGGSLYNVQVGRGAVLNLAGYADRVVNEGTVNINTADNDILTKISGGDINLNVAYNNSTNRSANGGNNLYVNVGLTNQGDIGGHIVNTTTVANSGIIGGVTNNGILTNAAGASIGYVVHNSATAFTNHGVVNVLENNGVVTNQGTMGDLYSNSGTFTNNGSLGRVSSNSGTFINNGTLVLDQSVIIAGTFTNAGTATLNQGASARSETTADVNNYYSVEYRQTSGTTTIDGDLFDHVRLEGGVLKGTGRIIGNLTVLNGAQVNPGNSPGLFTVYGDMTLDFGSVLNMEVINDNGILKYDQLIVEGNFIHNGQIKFDLGAGVSFSNGGFSSDGQTVVLADIFSLNLLPGLENTNLLVSDATGGTQYLTITGGNLAPVPEPETYAMMLVGLGLVGWSVRRRKTKTIH